ncbi:hypothetical protein J5X07_04445 [Actinomyces bowdenii]|uniref:hypothetical protein n=1 Tax=Actinomyces bowdenii TaxID=131109 RepID=UPI001ABD4411|nr:hypothetical protein [Actinomyces bowdenii]MBO3724280.1 hypothetical protein [Actinomyces bowdenii]
MDGIPRSPRERGLKDDWTTWPHAYAGVAARREKLFPDGEPAGHETLAPERISGQIFVRLETHTATVPGVQFFDDERRALGVPSRSGHPMATASNDGNSPAIKDAHIPATALKGVLSSAYELVTMSRFRVFGFEPGQHLFRRQRSDEGSECKQTAVLTARRRKSQESRANNQGDTRYDFFIQICPKKEKGGGGTSGTRTNKKRKVTERTVLEEYGELIYDYLIQNRNQPLHPRCNALVRGMIENQNINLSEITRENILDTIGAYLTQAGRPTVRVHIKKKNGTLIRMVPAQIGRVPHKSTPWDLADDSDMAPAQHIEEFSAGERLWGHGLVAGQESQRSRSGAGLATCNYRGHVEIIGSALPVADKAHLWTASGEGPDNSPFMLSELSSPKPQSGRPYLRAHDSSPLPPERLNTDFFLRGDLLIRKVYPTHRDEIGKKGRSLLSKLPQAAIWRASDYATEEIANNARERGTYLYQFIEPGSIFTFKLRFHNLSPAQLGVLLFLLSPKRLVPESVRNSGRPARGCLSLGHGKPYGLGAITMEALHVRCWSGQDLHAGYRHLTGCLGSCPSTEQQTSEKESSLPSGDYSRPSKQSSKDTIDELLSTLLSKELPGFTRSAPVRDFVISCYGLSNKGGKPLSPRYPSMAPQPSQDDQMGPIVRFFSKMEAVSSGKRANRSINIPDLHHFAPREDR